MATIYVGFGVIILYCISSLTLAKPLDDEKSFSDDNKLRCIDSNDGVDYDRSNTNAFSDYYKPHSRFEGADKYLNKPFDYNDKRSTSEELYDNLASGSLQKRQVGVVYKDDKPIGILQPYQRSYRFIPVKEDSSLLGIAANQDQDISYNIPGIADVDKREISGVNVDPVQLDESYPSILTNFKIVNKLDKKRNYDALTDENVRDLKATIRRLRSSNSHNNEQIEEELKNILDDMGLIEDEEVHGEKREANEEGMDDNEASLSEDEIKSDKGRNKRDECPTNENTDVSSKAIPEHNFLTNDEKRNEVKNDIFNHPAINKRESLEENDEPHRNKRQKPEVAAGINKENSDLVENLKDSGDLMLSGNKSPLASSSEIIVRDTDNAQPEKRPFEDADNDYEKRVERQIQSKINSLKEEVKREIQALKKRQNDNDEMQRKKRQVLENLISEETDDVNPVMNPSENELKPLIRKRRAVKHSRQEIRRNALNKRPKREIGISFNHRKKRNAHVDVPRSDKNYHSHHDETDEGGELLGGDDFDDSAILKRETYSTGKDYTNLNHENLDEVLYDRSKRAGIFSNDLDVPNNYFYNNYIYGDRSKRQNDNEKFRKKIIREGFVPIRNYLRSRRRRRINEDQAMPNRPQQLSDMSDLDLFGALPKSYDGELSRYKRVK